MASSSLLICIDDGHSRACTAKAAGDRGLTAFNNVVYLPLQQIWETHVQAWSDSNMARTRSARQKLLKFFRDNADMQTPSATNAEPAQQDMCGTLEIVENALRQPAGQQGSLKAEPYTIRSKSHWLVIHCLDRAGTLADIARVIAQHDQNIKVGLHSKCCSIF